MNGSASSACQIPIEVCSATPVQTLTHSLPSFFPSLALVHLASVGKIVGPITTLTNWTREPARPRPRLHSVDVCVRVAYLFRLLVCLPRPLP